MMLVLKGLNRYKYFIYLCSIRKSRQLRDAESKSNSAQCREPKLKSSTGRRISEKLENQKGKSSAFFFNEVIVLAVLKLTGSEFQVDRAADAKCP